MTEFKKGDKVEKVDGSCFKDGAKVWTVAYTGRDYVWFYEGTAWYDSFYLKLYKPYHNPPHKHAELIKAWADGAEIEYYNDCSGWVDNSCPSWDTSNEYRIKVSTKSKAMQELDELKTKVAELEGTIGEL